jgi:membrane protease YdiL (CAAX protease family)
MKVNSGLSISLEDLFVAATEEDPGPRLFLFLLLVILSFLVYWFSIESDTLKERFARRWGAETGSQNFFIFNKLWGGLWFGLICTIGAILLFPEFSLEDFGLSLPQSGSAMTQTGIWLVVLIPVMILMGWLGNRNTLRRGGRFNRYPEIRIKHWKGSVLLVHVVFWFLYLFAYELLFRGTLLFILASVIGPWPAVGVNVALYTAVHVPKGRQEAVGALPLGFLLCLITLSTGSIVVAVLAHAAIAIANGLFALHYRSDMGWGDSK